MTGSKNELIMGSRNNPRYILMKLAWVKEWNRFQFYFIRDQETESVLYVGKTHQPSSELKFINMAIKFLKQL